MLTYASRARLSFSSVVPPLAASLALPSACAPCCSAQPPVATRSVGQHKLLRGVDNVPHSYLMREAVASRALPVSTGGTAAHSTSTCGGRCASTRGAAPPPALPLGARSVSASKDACMS